MPRKTQDLVTASVALRLASMRPRPDAAENVHARPDLQMARALQ